MSIENPAFWAGENLSGKGGKVHAVNGMKHTETKSLCGAKVLALSSDFFDHEGRCQNCDWYARVRIEDQERQDAQ